MRALGFALMLSVGGAAFAGEPAKVPCSELLPHALNVGLPRIASTKETSTELIDPLKSVIAQTYRQAVFPPAGGSASSNWTSTRPAPPPDDCFGTERIQMNIAVGNDYQMLDWLDQGLLDAAVVSDLSLSLLANDDVILYELTDGGEAMDRIAPEARVTPQVRRRDQLHGKWLRETDAAGEYGRFLSDVWRVAASISALRKRGNAKALEEAQKLEDAPLPRMVVLSSHLSSTGFADPLQTAADRFAPLVEGNPALRDLVWNRYFASVRFAFDCDTFDECYESALAGERAGTKDAHKLKDRTLVILFPGEEALLREHAASAGNAYRQHFVITASAARRIFGLPAASRLPRPAPRTPPAVTAILRATKDGAPAFESLRVREPLFGVRTYSFTVDEALHLLRQQQRSSTDRNLALVLPGGGVKAAYQTRIIEELYEHHYLSNQEVAGDPRNAAALPVRTVIGTSGGALLGYFVSQLDASPVGLFDILWRPGRKTLTSGDVFASTDLLRYVSLVFSFAIFCFLLFLTSVRQGRLPGTTVFRWRLTLTVTLLFLLAPVIIRIVSGNDVEHIPEIEGIVYAIMAILVMVIDQLLVIQPNAAAPTAAVATPTLRERLRGALRSLRDGINSLGRDTREMPWYEAILVSTGLFFIGIPLLTFGPFGDVVREPLFFGGAFAVMTLLVLGMTLGALKACNQPLEHRFRRGLEIVSALVAVLVLCSFGVMFPIPHIIGGFCLMLVAAFDVWRIRYSNWKMNLQWLVVFVAAFIIAALCWPETQAPFGRFDLGFLMQESMRGISIGAFAVSIGFILLIVFGAMWTRRTGAYSINPQVKDLGLAMVILMAFAVVTMVLMGLLAWREWITNLELTLRFWGVLAIVSAGVAALILLTAYWKRGSSFQKAIAYLGGQHENGTIVQGRYARMLVFAIVAVFWWNIVEAPGLYGNRIARDYHRKAIARFNSSRSAASGSGFQPTARFVAPANLLQQDGTRYFLFLPPKEKECPSIPNRPASGAQWNVYYAAGVVREKGDRCKLRPGDELIANVAFASGSPFPIFPAHSVDVDHSGNDAYVDGGYSNNIPVDAARTLDAKQVLIVDSSSPLPPRPAGPNWLSRGVDAVCGRLVQNSGRLPAYLFDRSQQMDRISRRDMFVVSVAPSRDEPDWPPLFDFRAAVVERMDRTATGDMQKRIGMVESWGQPSFALHEEIAPVRTAREPAPAPVLQVPPPPVTRAVPAIQAALR
jgi:predicted acylesterase/phospholipase RssA